MPAADERSTLGTLLEPEAHRRVLARGLARNLIWREGRIPTGARGAQGFGPDLTAELLNYGYLLLDEAIANPNPGGDTERAFRMAAEAIEAACRRGSSSDSERSANLTLAGAAYQAAGYAARGYALLATSGPSSALSSTERIFAAFLRRDSKGFRANCVAWYGNSSNTQEGALGRIRTDAEWSVEDVIATAIKRCVVRGIAYVDSALALGTEDAFERGTAQLRLASESAREAGHVSLWWTSKMAEVATARLWKSSLHKVLPTEAGPTAWNTLRLRFLEMAVARNPPEIEVWPSQVEAVGRALDVTDDLVVALPTSAGKTRVAEICILRALSMQTRVVYVTPLRSLSAQQESSLGETFRPLGFTVSSLYGASGVTFADVDALRETDVVVATPEKLDFAIRQDPHLLDDVGLIVLDEGHMIGLGTREIRYEVLVQRLLSRPDSASRRIVCLSAIFTPNAHLTGFTNWIRSDSEGSMIHSNWRPTRQQIGIVRWKENAARLDFISDEQKPFIPSYILPRPARGRRRTQFPKDDNELVAATMDTLVREKQRVLVYSPLRKSVESFAELCVKLSEQGYLPSYLEGPAQVQYATTLASEWLGDQHVAARALSRGIGVHHGGLPRPFLAEIESLLKRRVLPVVVASPTIAQGLNLPCNALVFQSIYRNKKAIPAGEFANVVGRVGRAFVDIEGVSLYPMFDSAKMRAKTRQFTKLYASLQERDLESGILQLLREIASRLKISSETLEAFQEQVLGNDYTWVEPPSDTEGEGRPIEGLLDDLDIAALGSVEDFDVETARLAGILDDALRSSLWARHVAGIGQGQQEIQKAILAGRAQWVWKRSTPSERRSFFASGLGWAPGRFVRDNLPQLFGLLDGAETAFDSGDVAGAGDSLVELYSRVGSIYPFRTDDPPENWAEILRTWIAGKPLPPVLGDDATKGIAFVQDALVYRFVWATEAIRVFANASGQLEVENLRGRAARALTHGIPTPYAANLLEAGLASRFLAGAAVDVFPANPGEPEETWLRRFTEGFTLPPGWNSRMQEVWNRFVSIRGTRERGSWSSSESEAQVDWYSSPPATGAAVRVIAEPGLPDAYAVCDLDLQPIGRLRTDLRFDGANGVVAENRGIRVRCFGPR